MNKETLSDKEILSANEFYINRRDGLDWNFEEKLFNEIKAYNFQEILTKIRDEIIHNNQRN